MNKTVSVILPAYNAASFLPDSINSVLTQTYENIELIIIDDGSTDDTKNIVRSFSDKRLRYIQTQNQGNYFARNRGLKEASGDLIALIDADDIWLNHKLEKQVQVFQDNANLGFCCSDHNLFFDDKKSHLYKDTVNTFTENPLCQEIFLEKLLDNNFVVTSTVMFRRQCLEQFGLFDTSYQNAMDYFMWLNAAFRFPVFYIHNRLVLKRVHFSNISKNNIQSFKAVLYIFQKLSHSVKGTRFFSEKYLSDINRRIQKITYNLGIACLSKYKFADAEKFLKKSSWKNGSLIKSFSLVTASYKLGFFVPFINFYRNIKQKNILKKEGKKKA